MSTYDNGEQGTAPTRSRRREAMGEAPPPGTEGSTAAGGEGGEQLGMDDATPGGKFYFVKAKNKALWHAFNKGDEPIGSLRETSDGWLTRLTVGGHTIERISTSSVGAREYVAGVVDGYDLAQDRYDFEAS